MTLTDRSRILEYQRCPRARWWGYEYGRDESNVGGVTTIRHPVALLVGECVHLGLAHLLNQEAYGANGAVEIALSRYNAVAQESGLLIEGKTESALEQVVEQRALIEALLRAWAIEQLPKIVAEYEICEVEAEKTLGLFDDLTLMARPDALLRNRKSGDYFILSAKTTSSWDERKERECRHDVQGMSELVATEAVMTEDRRATWKNATSVLRSFGEMDLADVRLTAGYWADCWRVFEKAYNLPQRIEGVLMEFLLKGERRRDDDGRWRQESPLIRGWRRTGITTDEYTWKYFSACVEPHTRDNGKPCPGGKQHRLGAGWARFNAWELPGGVESWIDRLAAKNALAENFITPMPFYRQADEVESWLEQTRAQENAVAGDAASIRAMAGSKDRLTGDEDTVLAPRINAEIRKELDRRFPQHRRSCDYPGRCAFQELCFGSDPAEKVDPLSLGLYKLREPHHEMERERRTQNAAG